MLQTEIAALSRQRYRNDDVRAVCLRREYHISPRLNQVPGGLDVPQDNLPPDSIEDFSKVRAFTFLLVQ